MRPAPLNALDGVAFHYSIYRSISRFLGMDGNLQVAYDVDINFATAWNQMFVNNDFLNPATGQVDPRHMFGTSNFDVFRWPSLENGTQRSVLATFITSLVMPGIPLVLFCLYAGGLILTLFHGISISTVKNKTSISTILERRIIFTG
jgi:alpha-1,3-glucan synthase